MLLWPFYLALMDWEMGSHPEIVVVIIITSVLFPLALCGWGKYLLFDAISVTKNYMVKRIFNGLQRGRLLPIPVKIQIQYNVLNAKQFI